MLDEILKGMDSTSGRPGAHDVLTAITVMKTFTKFVPTTAY